MSLKVVPGYQGAHFITEHQDSALNNISTDSSLNFSARRHVEIVDYSHLLDVVTL
jgi:hypothetical protein